MEQTLTNALALDQSLTHQPASQSTITISYLTVCKFINGKGEVEWMRATKSCGRVYVPYEAYACIKVRLLADIKHEAETLRS